MGCETSWAGVAACSSLGSSLATLVGNQDGEHFSMTLVKVKLTYLKFKDDNAL